MNKNHRFLNTKNDWVRMSFIKLGTALFKLAVTAILIWLLFHKVDFGPIIIRFRHIHAGWAYVALIILFAQLLLTGVRWHLVCSSLGAKFSLFIACRLTLIGQFFNQVLPSSVGGDLVRVWQLSQEGVLLRRALASVVCDRIIALIMLTIIVAITLPIIILSGSFKSTLVLPVTIIIGLATLSILFLFLWGEIFHTLLIKVPYLRSMGALFRDLRIVLMTSYTSVRVLIVSIVVQIMVALSIYFIGLSLGIRLDFVHFSILPLIILLSSMPMSFAGWGLRESIMIVGLSFGGISENDALAISISFGIAQLFVGLPGAFIALVQSYRKIKSSL